MKTAPNIRKIKSISSVVLYKSLSLKSEMKVPFSLSRGLKDLKMQCKCDEEIITPLGLENDNKIEAAYSLKSGQ